MSSSCIKENSEIAACYGSTLLHDQLAGFDDGVPSLVSKFLHVCLTIASSCLGVDPHARRQLSTNPTALWLAVVHCPAFFAPAFA